MKKHKSKSKSKKKLSYIPGKPKEKKGTCLQKVCWVCLISVSEQIVSVVGSERSKNEMNSKYIWNLKFDYIEEDIINKKE